MKKKQFTFTALALILLALVVFGGQFTRKGKDKVTGKGVKYARVSDVPPQEWKACPTSDIWPCVLLAKEQGWRYVEAPLSNFEYGIPSNKQQVLENFDVVRARITRNVSIDNRFYEPESTPEYIFTYYIAKLEDVLWTPRGQTRPLAEEYLNSLGLQADEIAIEVPGGCMEYDGVTIWQHNPGAERWLSDEVVLVLAKSSQKRRGLATGANSIYQIKEYQGTKYVLSNPYGENETLSPLHFVYELRGYVAFWQPIDDLKTKLALEVK